MINRWRNPRPSCRAVKVESRPRGDVWMIRNFDGRAER